MARALVAEVEFRQGKREVPDHVSDMMKGLDTYRMTYEEAIEIANVRMASAHVEKAINNVIDGHFRNWGKP